MRALWRGEKVLILDEPTSMLTPQGVQDLGAVMQRLRDKGVALILITHKLVEAYELGDRISVLRLRPRGRRPSRRERLRQMSETQVTDRVIDMMFGTSAGRLPGGSRYPGRAVRQGRSQAARSIAAARPRSPSTMSATAADRGACPLQRCQLRSVARRGAGHCRYRRQRPEASGRDAGRPASRREGGLILEGRNITADRCPARRRLASATSPMSGWARARSAPFRSRPIWC